VLLRMLHGLLEDFLLILPADHVRASEEGSTFAHSTIFVMPLPPAFFARAVYHVDESLVGYANHI
jgi:hypothetical protein